MIEKKTTKEIINDEKKDADLDRIQKERCSYQWIYSCEDYIDGYGTVDIHFIFNSITGKVHRQIQARKDINDKLRNYEETKQ
jgi:hypothetical protein